MSGSKAAACILVVLVLLAGAELLDLPAAVRRGVQLGLILVAVVIGSKVERRRGS